MHDAFKLKYDTYLKSIQAYLDEKCFVYVSEPQKKLFDAMRYSLLAGGKRLRPIFVLDFCKMCGGDIDAAMPLAAAVEMIHTYSLIHDDLPCMDNDDFRRGKPTNHKVFGEAIAVLAGDGLLTAAFSSIATAHLCAEKRIKAVEILSTCSGELGMVGGQVLDMDAENRICTEQEVLDIHSRKTVALIRASCMIGVVAGNGTQLQHQKAAEFAYHLGLAFQIRDDMLDVIGDKDKLGKAVGTDADKNTFVRLYGLDACDNLVKSHTEKALQALDAFNDTDFMSSLAVSLVERTY